MSFDQLTESLSGTALDRSTAHRPCWDELQPRENKRGLFARNAKMKTEDIQSPFGDIYSPHEASGSWTQRRDTDTKQRGGDQMHFARPAITTGACLPWNVNTSKASFWPPRAFNNQQLRPAITILSNKQESTKLVYSKDTSKNSLLYPAETPFRPKSKIKLSDEEDQSEAEVFKPLGAGESASQPQVEIMLNDGDSPPDFRQTSSGSSVHHTAVPVASNSESHCLQAPQADSKLHNWTQGVQEASTGEVGSQTTIPSSFWQPQVEPLQGEVKLSLKLAPLDNSHLEERSVARSGFNADSGLQLALHKSSGNSSQLNFYDLRAHAQDLPVTESSHDQVPNSANSNDNCSRSQSLEDIKRKFTPSDTLCEACTCEDQTAPDRDSEEHLQSDDWPPAKRRLTSRATALKTAEKRSQEVKLMESTIQKLHSDHAEMQAKCRHHMKECDDLKIHLAEAQEKLKTQEEINAKMTLELHYLRSNLAVLTNFPGQVDPNVSSEQLMIGTPQHLSADGGAWMSAFSMPVSLPTREQMAAELDVECGLLAAPSNDCTLIPAPSQLIPEWQLW